MQRVTGRKILAFIVLTAITLSAWGTGSAEAPNVGLAAAQVASPPGAGPAPSPSPPGAGPAPSPSPPRPRLFERTILPPPPGASLFPPAVVIRSPVFNAPYGHAFDKAGNLWVANNRPNTVLEFARANLARSGTITPTHTLTATNTGVLDMPHSPAFDAAGNLWVANSHADQVVKYTTNPTTGVRAPSVTATLKLNATTNAVPAALAFDSAGNLWVTDALHDVVLKYTAASLTNGASPLPVTAVTGFGDIGGVMIAFGPSPPGTAGGERLWVPVDSTKTLHGYSAAQLAAPNVNAPGSVTITGAGFAPFSVAFDAAGNMYVADLDGDAVLIYTARQTTISGSGPPAGAIANAVPRNIIGPLGLAFDVAGNLWVGNFFGDRIIKYTKAQLATVLPPAAPATAAPAPAAPAPPGP
jgi:sugar lactone lactonase YvrE